jgi:hypothetical protein
MNKEATRLPLWKWLAIGTYDFLKKIVCNP